MTKSPPRDIEKKPVSNKRMRSNSDLSSNDEVGDKFARRQGELSPTNEDVNITIVGSGQISAALVFLFCERSHDIDLYNTQNDTSNPKYSVSILARSGSESFETIKNHGIYINIKEPEPGKKENVSKGKVYSSQTGTKADFLITDNKDEIPPSDFIILAVNNVPGTYNPEFRRQIKNLVDHAKNPDTVRVVMAQNGIPASYIAQQDRILPTIMDRSSSSQDEDSHNFSRYSQNIQEELQLITEIGIEKFIICSLNMACERIVDARRREGSKVGTSSYKLVTPVPNIYIPSNHAIEFLATDREKRILKENADTSLRKFWKICQDIGINYGGSNDIEHEMYKKLQVDMISPICTITGKKIGQVLKDSSCLTVFSAMMMDIEKINGSSLRNLEQMENWLCQRSEYDTNMSQAFARGDKMEIDLLLNRSLLSSFVKRGRVSVVINDIIPILENMERNRDQYIKDGCELMDAVQKARESVSVQFQDFCNMMHEVYKGRKCAYEPTLDAAERKRMIKNLKRGEEKKIKSSNDDFCEEKKSPRLDLKGVYSISQLSQYQEKEQQCSRK